MLVKHERRDSGDDGVSQSGHALVMETLWARIQSILDERDWSERELGRRAGLKSETHVGLLKTTENPNRDTLVKIAAAGEVELDWLASGRPPRRRGEVVREPAQPTTSVEDTRELHPLDVVLEEEGWVAAAGLTFEQAQMVVGDLQALRTKATVPLPRSAWRDERDRAVNRALGRDARVHRREPVTPPFDPDAPSPELLELKAKRAAEKAKRAAEKAKRAAEKAEREPAAKANRAKKR
jgi:transcriptional regulator with XRE-family HTH domain